MDLLIVAVAGLLAIAGATQLSDRVKVAPALLLLGLGIVVGFLPVVPAIEIEPEIILEGVLPPLLYATAVSISTINFRRELAPVAVLAVLLVAVSAAVIGAVSSLQVGEGLDLVAPHVPTPLLVQIDQQLPMTFQHTLLEAEDGYARVEILRVA